MRESHEKERDFLILYTFYRCNSASFVPGEGRTAGKEKEITVQPFCKQFSKVLIFCRQCQLFRSAFKLLGGS